MEKKKGVLLSVEENDLALLDKKGWRGVRTIGANCFSFNTNLEAIEIPKGVKEIGVGSFSCCAKLKEVNLPSTLKLIDKEAFDNCQGLEKIEIPKGVKEIGVRSFRYCKNLREIKLPATLKVIGKEAFDNCRSLEKVEILKGVKEIDVGSFKNCVNLQEVKLPLTLKVIAPNVFEGCKKLERIEIPEGVEKIDEEAFLDCVNLKEVRLPSTLKTIENRAFTDCRKLERIEIPEGVEKIETGAFIGCSNLKEIKLPSTLKVIGENIFYSCEQLERMEIPKGLERLEKGFFIGCENLKEVKLPSTLKEIGKQAFLYCNSLERIEIPEGVEKIETGAFSSCNNLKEIKLPSTLKEIGKNSFFYCNSLERMEIPEGVEKIDVGAFSNCENLKEVKLPSTLNMILRDTFNRCDALEIIEIPDDIEKIEQDAFRWCYNLKKIKFMGIEFDVRGTYFPTIYLEKINDYIKNKEQLYDMYTASDRLKKQGILIPESLINENNMDEYLYDNEYRYMKNLINLMPEEYRENNLAELYKIAKAMGVLEKDSVTVKVNGKDMPINGVAYEILQRSIKKGQLDLERLHMNFQSLPNDGKCNVELLKFMANKTNLEELLNRNSRSPGFFDRVYRWFEDRKNLVIDENSTEVSNLPTEESNRYKIRTYKTVESGIDKLKWNAPTVELFAKEFAANKFSGMVDERSKEIGEYLSEFSLYEQRHFDKALEIDKERVDRDVKDHLTKKIIKEDIIESLDDYKRRTGELKQDIVNELGETLKTQTDTASQIFTYEMLAKSDKANFAMGFLTSCCATLYGAGAGAQRAMILHPDMQPLVIKNIKGEIVCFGIIYVNRKEGYAVVNDFELNKQYDTDEVREEIYNKTMQGVNAFVTQYNKENDDNPIKIVTSGISPNWVAINDFIRENPTSEILKAPDFGDFKYAGSGWWPGDWHKDQHVIWEIDRKDGAKR